MRSESFRVSAGEYSKEVRVDYFPRHLNLSITSIWVSGGKDHIESEDSVPLTSNDIERLIEMLELPP